MYIYIYIYTYLCTSVINYSYLRPLLYLNLHTGLYYLYLYIYDKLIKFTILPSFNNTVFTETF